MLNKSILYVLLMISLIGMSCKKYLDKKSDNDLVVPHTLSNLQGVLDDDDFMNLYGTPDLGEASSDDHFLTPDAYNSLYVTEQKIYTWSIDSGDYEHAYEWGSSYRAVFNANYCLDKLKNIKRSSENARQWDNIRGSALFFRSYYFLLLAWDYAKAYDPVTADNDLGIALRLTSDFNVRSKRVSVQKTYEQIIKDTKEAASRLPDLPSHVVRPSRCAAFALLARTYLGMRKYDSAYKYADWSLKIKNDLLDYNSSAVDSTSGSPFPPFNKEILFYTIEAPGHYSKNPGIASIDTTLYSSYADNDLRKFDFFYPDNGYHAFKGNYNSDAFYQGFFSGIATDEMYLTRAECEARLGKVSAAMKDLNMLLIKRWHAGTFTPLKANGKQQALKIILSERRKELLMRGMRWMDIKRLNKGGANIVLKRNISGQTYTLSPNANYYALPFPSDIIKLSGMKQNPL